MRRDVKLGLAIGGVLILVVVVFAIINSSHHNQPGAEIANGPQLPQTPVAPTPAAAPGATGGASDALLTSTTTQPTGLASATPSTDPSATAIPETRAAPTSDKKTDWAMALTHGTFDAGSKLVQESPMPPSEKLDNGVAPKDPTPAPTPDATPVMTETPTPTVAGSPGVVPPTGTVAAAPADPATRTDADTIISAAYNVTTTQPAGVRTHVIRSGETFSSIAAAAYGSSKYYLAIAKANPTVNPNKLRPNTTIVLPEISEAKPATPALTPTTSPSRSGVPSESARAAANIDATKEYVVKSGDSLYKISEKLYGDSKHTDELYQTNKDAIGPNPEKLKLGEVLKLTMVPTKL